MVTIIIIIIIFCLHFPISQVSLNSCRSSFETLLQRFTQCCNLFMPPSLLTSHEEFERFFFFLGGEGDKYDVVLFGKLNESVILLKLLRERIDIPVLIVSSGEASTNREFLGFER